MTLKITQHLPEAQMGRNRVGFSIDLGDTGFRRFVSNLPHGQADYYLQRSEALKATVVEVMMPGEYMDQFDLSNPSEALGQMQECSMHSKNHTTSYILSNVVKAVA